MRWSSVTPPWTTNLPPLSTPLLSKLASSVHDPGSNVLPHHLYNQISCITHTSIKSFFESLLFLDEDETDLVAPFSFFLSFRYFVLKFGLGLDFSGLLMHICFSGFFIFWNFIFKNINIKKILGFGSTASGAISPHDGAMAPSLLWLKINSG